MAILHRFYCTWDFLLIACMLKASFNTHAALSSEAESLILGPCLTLLQYFVYAKSEGSNQTVHMHRLVWALAACWGNNCQNLVCQPNYSYKPPTVIMVIKVFPQKCLHSHQVGEVWSFIYLNILCGPARRAQAASKKDSSSQQEGHKQPARRTQAASKKGTSSAERTRAASKKHSSSQQKELKQPARSA